jgi:hypothetical protein
VKKLFWLLVIFSVLFSLASCNRRIIRVKPVVGYAMEEGVEIPQELVLENQYLELRFITETAGIILKDKVKGMEWHSTPPDVDNDKSATVVTMDLMKSQFSLQYADVSGVGETLYSGTQSVEKENYNFEIINNGIEVNYTVGNVARTYIIPITCTEERFKHYMDRINPSYKNRVEASYRLYDINNLRSNDNRAELLSQYPDLADQKLWIIRDATQEFMKADMESWFHDAGYTREEFMEDAARQISAGVDERPAFSITIRYELDGKSLIVSVPYDSIAYRASYPPTRLDLLPFMGAAGINDQGYMFVPDGSGALVYFNNGKFNQIASNNPVFGWDEAIPRDAVIINNKAPFPVFGIQKNGNALVCIIEEGSSYARITADVSGRNAAYNRVYAYFDIVHGAILDISGRSDRAVYLYENGLPQGESIKLRYTVCEEPGYMGMAKEYREWLIKNNPHLASRSFSDLPVAVEIIGAVNKTQHRMGIPFDLPLMLTSYKETQDIINDLGGMGWKNAKIKLSGWFNRSYEHRVPTNITLINELGSRRDFEKIVDVSQQNGFSLFPEADFVFVRDLRAFDGFSLYRDAARYVTRKRVEKYPYSFVWFGERIRWGKLNYLVRPEVSMNMVDGYVDKISKMGMQNIAFRNMGSSLAGDFNEKRHVSREASMRMRAQKFEQLHNAGNKVMVNAGYSYSAPWADIIVDMALDCQGFAITDAAVPFYQIALSGMVPYTGRAINLAEDYTMNILKTIESGAGLHFSFIKEETVELQETKFRQFYANEYDKWIDDANDLYQRFSTDFAGIYGQQIVDHRILAPGITETQYRDGTVVYVNMNENNYEVRRGR